MRGVTYRINVPVPRWVFLVWTWFLDRKTYDMLRRNEAGG